MKKILAIAASLILVVVSANSQTEKKEPPPPPPPKQVDEKVKFSPPKIVKDEEVTSTKTKTEKNKKETPPKVNMTKFKPPVIDENLREFYRQNPSVANFSMKDNKVTLILKDGKKEEYNFKNDDDNKSFTEKYGKAPVPPPPPPKIKTKA